jgi:hypothetical protein
MDSGEFAKAAKETVRMAGLLQQLASAEQVLGYIGKGSIVNGADLEIGMQIVGIGTVAELYEEDCEGCGGRHPMARTTGGEELPLDDAQFVVSDG